jgi:hypothetical protein
MNRLTPRIRRVALATLIVLALLVLPSIQIIESIRSGRSTAIQLLNAERIAGALRSRLSSADLQSAETSTDLFNRLLREGAVTESMFYTPGFGPLKRRTNGDGTLQPEENCFALVVGLPEKPDAGTPVLLWDPKLRKDKPPRRRWSRPSRWLVVDSAGKAAMVRLDAVQEWGRTNDFLPSLPGEQRLLRP